VLCKDRLFERFRSLYAQRPTQSSVLRRRLISNAEVAQDACIGHMVSCGHNMLAQAGIVQCIPGLTAQSVIKLSSTHPDCLHYNYEGRNSNLFLTSHFTLFLFFLQDEEVCSCSAEGCRCLINGRSSHVNIECVRIGS
jgi:hypothetical protein